MPKHRGVPWLAVLLVLMWAIRGYAQNAASTPRRVLDLDGKGSYVELPPNIFAKLSEATVEGWVKWDSTGYFPRFWNFGGTQASQEVGLVEDGTDLLFGFSRGSGELGGFRVLNSIRLGEWYHVAAVSGKGGMKLYLNGSLAALGGMTGSFDTIASNVRNCIGLNTWKDGGGRRNQEAKMQVAEFRVWSVARTEGEIRSALNRSLTGSEPGLFGLWNFENVENGLAKDSGPNRFHGQMKGNARTATAQLPVLPESGPTMSALELDGHGSYLELPPNIFTNLTQATVEGWVKWSRFGHYSRFFDFGARGNGMAVNNQDSVANLTFHLYAPANAMHFVRARGILRTNEWCHVAAVTGPQGMKLYFNGRLAAADGFSGSFAAITKREGSFFGHSAWSLPTDADEDFQGQMGELRVWGVARTEEQIRADMGRPLTGKEPGLAALWNFKDGTAKDSTPNGNHGILRGQARIVPVPRPTSDGGTARVMYAWNIRGKVIDPDGKPLPRVRVRFEVEGEEVGAVSTEGETGQFSAMFGAYAKSCDVEALAENGRVGGWKLGVQFMEANSSLSEWVLGPAPVVPGSVLSLDPKAGLNGVVVQALGRRMPASGVDMGAGLQDGIASTPAGGQSATELGWVPMRATLTAIASMKALTVSLGSHARDAHGRKGGVQVGESQAGRVPDPLPCVRWFLGPHQHHPRGERDGWDGAQRRAGPVPDRSVQEGKLEELRLPTRSGAQRRPAVGL